MPKVTQMGRGRAGIRTYAPIAQLLPPGTFLEGGLSPEDDGGVLEGSGSLGEARTLEWSQTGTMGSQRRWWPRVGVSWSQGLRG